MSESWYKKVVTEYKDGIIKSAVVALLAAFVFSAIYYLLGKGYEWREVNLPEPTLTLRLLSGLVFSSLGRILYKLKSYYVLKIILVGILRLYGLYRTIKTLIWYFLMFIMGFYIVQWIVDVINFTLTVLLNAAMILVYIAPAIFVFVVVFLPAFFFLERETKITKEAL